MPYRRCVHAIQYHVAFTAGTGQGSTFGQDGVRPRSGKSDARGWILGNQYDSKLQWQSERESSRGSYSGNPYWEREPKHLPLLSCENEK